MLSNVRAALALLGGACALIGAALAPLPERPVTLRADFEARSGSGWATFEGSMTLRGRRSLWDKARFGPLDHAKASRALESGLRSGLARPEPRDWARRLSQSCAAAMARDAGGQWSAQTLDGFRLRQSPP